MSGRRKPSVKGSLYLVGLLLAFALAWMWLQNLLPGQNPTSAPGEGASVPASPSASARASDSAAGGAPEPERSARSQPSGRSTPATRATRDGARATDRSGLPTCDLATLPPEATDTVRLIEAGGPFPHPRNDGVTFGNREGLLPSERRGYYREYTVKTPRASTRGARRIVTGGNPATDPPHWYYTADHYDSFCVLTGR